MQENKRGQWGSTFGFLMASIGSAIGLGNLWGFPYKMGSSGGFAFLVVYLILFFLYRPDICNFRFVFVVCAILFIFFVQKVCI